LVTGQALRGGGTLNPKLSTRRFPKLSRMLELKVMNTKWKFSIGSKDMDVFGQMN
jgi:hypothetical protein